jgi:hypothetical protein
LARLDDKLANELGGVVASDAALRLAEGNKHLASSLRKTAIRGVAAIATARRKAQRAPW